VARKKKQEEGGGDSFTVMFTSLSIILLAFFILLNSMGTIKEDRVKAAIGSLTATFSAFGSGPLFPRADAVITIGEQLAVVAHGSGRMLKKTIDEMLVKEGVGDEVDLVEDGGDMLLMFKDQIIFDSGRAYIKPQMTEIIKVLAGFIGQVECPVVVEGHTDNIPIHTARFPSNWELSTARAGAVVRRLLESYSIDAHKLSGQGHGEFKPRVSNDTPENRAVNRRVVVRFVGMAAAEKEKAAGGKDLGNKSGPETGI